MKTMDEMGKVKQSDKFKKYTHTSILTGGETKLDVGYERFLGPEMFFHPVNYFHFLIYMLIGIHPQRLESSIR